MGEAPVLRDHVEDRVWAALADLVAEGGYASLSVEGLLERSGVRRAEFEARYAGIEDCVLQVYEASIDHFLGLVRAAYAAERTWRDGLRAAAYAAAEWIAGHPRKTRFGMVDVLEAESEMVRVRREELFRVCAALIDAGRAEAPDPQAIPASAPILAIGSIAEMLTRQLQGGRAVQPTRMVPQLMYLAVRPYVGEAVAREELLIPPPTS